MVINMILVEKGNVQLSISITELDKYLSMGFVKYEPKKVEDKKITTEIKTIKKSLKED